MTEKILNFENYCNITLSALEVTSKKQKKGFTLAEVIIVISILGIIAAMTIGSLYNSNKKSYVEVRLKKAFSVLDNAFGVLEAEDGGPDNFRGQITSANGVIDRLNSILNVSSKCSYNIDGIPPCFAGPYGKPYDIEGEAAQSGTDGLILKDGMSFAVSSYHNCGCLDIVVDIDGPFKGPSLLGYDVFLFSYGKYGKYKFDGKTRCPGSNSRNQSCPTVGLMPGGSSGYCSQLDFYANDYIIKNYYQRGCAKDVETKLIGGWNTRGVSCSILIAKNNWKIPNDYPWSLVTKTPAGFRPLNH